MTQWLIGLKIYKTKSIKSITRTNVASLYGKFKDTQKKSISTKQSIPIRHHLTFTEDKKLGVNIQRNSPKKTKTPSKRNIDKTQCLSTLTSNHMCRTCNNDCRPSTNSIARANLTHSDKYRGSATDTYEVNNWQKTYQRPPLLWSHSWFDRKDNGNLI